MSHHEKLDAHAANIESLLREKIFKIPSYQRAYAWQQENWEDFWNDLTDGLETNSIHYWGTITLRNTKEEPIEDENTALSYQTFEVVDGQQRLTTLFLLLLAISRKGTPALFNSFIKTGGIYRIEAGNLNNNFLKNLFDGNPQSEEDLSIRSNKLLLGALEFFEERIEAYSGNLESLTKYLKRTTFALEFTFQDESIAIRAFESLNDRGRPLSLLEKTKSFLMFCSFRYLDSDSTIRETINDCFGEAFADYDLAIDAATRANVDFATNPRYRFNEDELLRFYYHHCAYSFYKDLELVSPGYDYSISTQAVFDQLVKQVSKSFYTEPKKLTRFTLKFCKGLRDYFKTFKELMISAESNGAERRLLTFLGISADVYPLLIGLKQEEICSDNLLKLIETLDIRVYKLRGTGPRALLYRHVISKIAYKRDSESIENGIKKVITQYSPDPSIPGYLQNIRIHKNPSFKFILWNHESSLALENKKEFDEWDYDLYSRVDIEHIFASEVTLGFPSHGFKDAPDFDLNKDRPGNLALLERKVNRRVSNKSVLEKASSYQTQAEIPSMRSLGHQIAEKGFTKEATHRREKEISDFCIKHWPEP